MKVFVYGTLKTGEHNHRIIAPFTAQARRATIIGTMYLVANFPGFIQEGEDEVVGELVDILPGAEADALFALDRLEGFHPDYPEHSMYLRKEVSARLDDGGEETCYVYVWNRPIQQGLNPITEYSYAQSH